MADPLDVVADRLAQEQLAVRHSTRFMARAEERSGVVGTITLIAGTVGTVVSSWRHITRLPDQRATRRLYEEATGVDRDRANADLALVADRLSPLLGAPDGAHGDALVRAAARRLVAWVAAGRTDEEQMSGIEAAFAQWVRVAEHDKPDEAAFAEAIDSYVDVWQATTRPPSGESV